MNDNIKKGDETTPEAKDDILFRLAQFQAEMTQKGYYIDAVDVIGAAIIEIAHLRNLRPAEAHARELIAAENAKYARPRKDGF